MKVIGLFTWTALGIACLIACEKNDLPSAEGTLRIPEKGKLTYTITASDYTHTKGQSTMKLVAYFDKTAKCDILRYYSDGKPACTIVYDNTKYYKIDDSANLMITEDTVTEPFFHILGVPENVPAGYGPIQQDNGIAVLFNDKGYQYKLSEVETLAEDVGKLAKDLVASAQRKEVKLEDSSFPYTSWMKSIPDNIPLNDITLPGTHDSGTLHTTAAWPASLWTNCQDSSIAEQLSMGIRLFDLRLGYYEGDICLYHGEYRCLTSQKYWFFNDPDPVRLKDILSTFQSFLQNNPSETIVIQLKKEYDDGWSDQRWLDKGLGEIQKKGNLCIMDETRLPKLGEARGKVVIISRSNPFGNNIGNFCAHFTDWPDDNPLFQCSMCTDDVVNFEGSDAYGGWWSNESKWEVVEEMFKNHSFDIGNGRGMVTFTSGTGASCPRDLASTVTEKICSYNYQAGKCYGWVFMDFVENKHVKSLVEPYLSTTGNTVSLRQVQP